MPEAQSTPPPPVPDPRLARIARLNECAELAEQSLLETLRDHGKKNTVAEPHEIESLARTLAKLTSVCKTLFALEEAIRRGRPIAPNARLTDEDFFAFTEFVETVRPDLPPSTPAPPSRSSSSDPRGSSAPRVPSPLGARSALIRAIPEVPVIPAASLSPEKMSRAFRWLSAGLGGVLSPNPKHPPRPAARRSKPASTNESSNKNPNPPSPPRAPRAAPSSLVHPPSPPLDISPALADRLAALPNPPPSRSP